MHKKYYVEGKELTLRKIIEIYKLSKDDIKKIQRIKKIGYCAYLGKPNLPIVHRVV